MGFCHRCGEITMGKCSKCGGRSVASTISSIVSDGTVSMTDRWQSQYADTILAPEDIVASKPITGKVVSVTQSSFYNKPNTRKLCTCCSKTMTTTDSIIHDSLTYCKECHLKLFNKGKCPTCQHLVSERDPFIEYSTSIWHAECFTCFNCKTNLDANPLIDLKNRPCCEPCFMNQSRAKHHVYPRTTTSSRRPGIYRDLFQPAIDTATTTSSIVTPPRTPSPQERKVIPQASTPLPSSPAKEKRYTPPTTPSERKYTSPTTPNEKRYTSPATPNEKRYTPATASERKYTPPYTTPTSTRISTFTEERNRTPPIRASTLAEEKKYIPTTAERKYTPPTPTTTTTERKYTPPSPTTAAERKYTPPTPTTTTTRDKKPTSTPMSTPPLTSYTKNEDDNIPNPTHSASRSISRRPCHYCHEPLGDASQKKTKVSLGEGLYAWFHKSCFLCSKCHLPFKNGECATDGHSFYHPLCDLGKSCFGCKKQIAQDAYQFNDKMYHFDCFKCYGNGCAISLGQPIFEVGKRPFCQPCYELSQNKPVSKKFGGSKTCPRCKSSISIMDSTQGPLASQWHKKCLSCTMCHKPLDSSAKMKTGLKGESLVYCRTCFS